MKVATDLLGRNPIFNHCLDLFACLSDCPGMWNNPHRLMHLMFRIDLTPPHSIKERSKVVDEVKLSLACVTLVLSAVRVGG